MGDELMRPQDHDSSITIPVTFDYKGGRGSNIKAKTFATLAIVIINIIVVLGLTFSDLNTLLKILIILLTLYIGLFILRFVVFKELHFSDVYEGLLAKDFKMDVSSIWQIFEVAENYPYICYFKNGQKGLFVRMEMGTITGKSDTVMYDHYEAISDAYNIAHSLDMNIIHIDYMDNVGNDDRLQKLYDDLYQVKNPEMQSMLVDIYDNIQEEMTRNYANYDIYLFLTKDRIDNFMYNVQTVCSKMTEGNFITYRVMDATEIATTVKALFNLHEFSVVNANEATLLENRKSGIVPIKVYRANGTVEELNKTQAEQKRISQEKSRKLREQMTEKKAEKRRMKQIKKGIIDPSMNFDANEQVGLFTSLEDLGNQQVQQVQQPNGFNNSNNMQQLNQPNQVNNQSLFNQNKQAYNPSQQLFNNGQVMNNLQGNNVFNNQQNQQNNNSMNLFK